MAGEESGVSVAPPEIWVGCLHCYNAGRLVGEWFDIRAADSIDLVAVHGCQRIFAGCEELLVLDTDGLPEGHEMGLLEAAGWAQAYRELEPELRSAFLAWVESGAAIACGHGTKPDVDEFREHYQGSWGSFSDFARGLAEDLGLTSSLPGELQNYLDWPRWTRDLESHYTAQPAPDGGVFVFSNP